MECSLILVGTELLNGVMVDTNSLYMANELNKYGVKITRKFVVGDREEDMLKTLEFAKKTSDLVIMSGGLGPTDDDLTKSVIAKFLNKKLIVESEELEEIKEKFKKANIEFLRKNHKEVEKPEGAISIKNDVGMAPAIYIDGIAAFPGVPKELYNMFPKFLELYFKEKSINPIYIKDILVFGMAESIVEEKIKAFFIEPNIEYEFLIKDYGIIVRMQSKISEKNKVEKIREKIYNSIGNYIIGEDTKKLEDCIIEILREKKYMISVAESCTGGLLATRFVKISGVSDVFFEGVITYNNLSKKERLNVSEESLEKYGAVSEVVAKEMVKGLKTQIGISVTGIAGPTGGNKDKPVGLVYIGLKVNDNIKCMKYNFIGDRDQIRLKATNYALFELYRMLKEDEKK